MTALPSPQDMNTVGIIAKPCPYDPVSWAHLQYWTAVAAEQASKRHGVKSHLLTNNAKTAAVCAARVEVVWNLRRQWMQTLVRSPRRFMLAGDYYLNPDGRAWQPLSFPVIGKLLHKDHSAIILIWNRALAAQDVMPDLPVESPAACGEPAGDADKRGVLVGVDVPSKSPLQENPAP